MGGAPSITYCVPVTQKPEGESAIYRLAEFKDQLRDRPKENLGTMKDVILNSSKLYADFPALGKSLIIQELSLKAKKALK